MRQAHWLKPNRGARAPERIIAFDTETDSLPLGPGEVEAVLRFGWAVTSRRHRDNRWTPPRWHRFTTSGGFWGWLEGVLRDGERATLYAHNLGFDFRVVKGFSELPARGWTCRSAVIEDPPTILRWRKGRKGILALDTMNYSRSSLAEIGEQVGLPKLDPAALVGSQAEADAYCRRDAEIVLRFMQGFIGLIREWDLGYLAPTLAGQAFTAWRHRHLSVPIFIDAHPRALELARRAYRGGRVEAFRIGVVEGPIEVFDVRSMYPSVMLTTAMPTVLRTWARRMTVGELAASAAQAAAVADVDLDTETADYPLVRDGKLIFPVGQFRTVLTSPELDHALARGRVTWVHEVALYDRAVIFASYVREWHERRMSALAAGDVEAAWQAKLMMNALYGKLGQSGQVFETIGDADPAEARTWTEWDHDTGRRIGFRAIAGLVQRRGEARESRDSHPAIAATVTAAARMALLSLMEAPGRANVRYVDTDSLFVLREACGPLWPLVAEARLASLVHERTIDEFLVHTVKDYVRDDQRVIKGVRANAHEVSPGVFEQDMFVGLRGALRAGDMGVVTIRRVVKRLARGYDKGIVGPDGWVTPHRLSL